MRGRRGRAGIASFRFRLLFRLFDRALDVGLESSFVFIIVIDFNNLSRTRRSFAGFELLLA